jgi:hypothetical protein
MTYLIFVDDGDDAATYHKDKLISMTCATNATLLMNFDSSIGEYNPFVDVVTLTITADKEREVMESIIKKISQKGRIALVIADDTTTAATSGVSVIDGDAEVTVAEKEYITLISTDATSKTYVMVDDNETSVATGDILISSSDTGLSTAGAELAGGIAVAINLTGAVASQWDLLDQLEDAIESSNGHNGKIVCSDLAGAEADGEQSMIMTQNVNGTAGNTAIIHTLGDASGSYNVTFNDQFQGGTNGTYASKHITACSIALDSST